MKNLIFFFQNSNIRTRSEITEPELKILEPELKILEPDPKYRNIRTSSILLYRNTRKSEIPDLNPNNHPDVLSLLQFSFFHLMVCCLLSLFFLYPKLSLVFLSYCCLVAFVFSISYNLTNTWLMFEFLHLSVSSTQNKRLTHICVDKQGRASVRKKKLRAFINLI